MSMVLNHTKLERRKMKKINQAGLELLVEHFEGLVLTSYPDPGTKDKPWTIGYGHTGPDIFPGMVISQVRALQLLQEDLQYAERQVDVLVPVVSANQFAALTSFTFNEGVGKFKTSTLRALHNAGDYAGAALEFKKWIYSNGQIMQGLIIRRAAEAALYQEV